MTFVRQVVSVVEFNDKKTEKISADELRFRCKIVIFPLCEGLKMTINSKAKGESLRKYKTKLCGTQIVGADKLPCASA
jgi:hypothetical protein